jgi:hypothetical protein
MAAAPVPASHTWRRWAALAIGVILALVGPDHLQPGYSILDFLRTIDAQVSAVLTRLEGRWAMPIGIWIFSLGALIAIAAVAVPSLLTERQKHSAPTGIGGTVIGRVVVAQGICPLGLRFGDTVRFAPDGTVSPALCAPAQSALASFVERVRRGEQVEVLPCCPIWEHLLAFRLAVEPSPLAA